MILAQRALNPRLYARMAAHFSAAKEHKGHDNHHTEHKDVVHHESHDAHHDVHDSHGHGHGHHVAPSRPPVEYNTIQAFLDHKNLKTYFEVGPGYMKYPGVESGHHHHEEYDWRDDPKYNEDITVSSRHKNNPDPKTYVWPFEGRTPERLPLLALNQDYHYNPAISLRPENKKIGIVLHHLKAAEWNKQDDVNHEFDYESEDLDFQCDSFKSQHFRKKGAIWPWVLVASIPFVYFWAEFLYQHYPDEDHWKITHPPPLNFPDSEDTDDTDTYKDYHRPEGRYLRDIGIVGDLWFDIKDGKKVYDKWAGVNQPLEDI